MSEWGLVALSQLKAFSFIAILLHILLYRVLVKSPQVLLSVLCL